MRSGGPHAGPPPPAKIHENMQSPQAGAVPMPDAFPHTFSAVPHTGHLPIRFQRIPHTAHKLQKIRLQSRRDQHSGLHISPTNRPQITQHTSAPARPWRAHSRRDQRGRSTQTCASNRSHHLPCASGRLTQTYAFYQLTQTPCAGEGGMGTASLRDAATASTGEPALSWSGLWPGSPGNRGRPDSAKARRRGAGSRRTDGRSRRPPARPGVMRALRRWGTVSLSF